MHMRKTAIAMLAAFPLPALASEKAAGITGMCVAMFPQVPPARCTCATSALLEAVSLSDTEFYSEIAAAYVAKHEGGVSLVAAWDAAVAEVSEKSGLAPTELQKLMNPVGRAHRAAIKACE